MSRKPTWAERARYSFDKSMSAGPVALIGWLGLITLIVIIAAAIILDLTDIANEGTTPMPFFEGFWQSLMRTMDAGTMAGDTGWPFRIVALLITLSGIFIFSALIGILSSGLNDRLTELRKGRSRVLEEGHTVILNWSPSIFDIISELAIANASERRPRLVIMANRDKVEMEDEIAAKIPRGRMKIVCRSGDPADLYDLALVSPDAAKSIVVLSPEGEDPDSHVIKTVLALVNDPKRTKKRYRIAAEIRSARNADIARIVGGGEVQLVLADELIARILVHSSRQVGLSAVYSELLDFEGCEIYTTERPELTGKTYTEAAMAFEAGSLIGLCAPDGAVRLNPPGATRIEAGLRCVVIAEDDTAIRLSATPPRVATAGIRPPVPIHYEPERTLVIGWNRRGARIATELARYVQPGSLLTIAGDVPYLAMDVDNLPIDAARLKVELRVCDTADRDTLIGLDITSYDHVIVLGYSDDLSSQAADTRTLVTLLHLRRIMDATGKRVSVVSEMIDVRNRELAEVTRADDFIVSNRLVSLMLAQASENEYLAAIFAEILDERGSEIYLRAVEDLVDIAAPVTFHTVAEAALRRGETAFGHIRRRAAHDDVRKMGGVVINPARNDAIAYEHGDRIIVLSEG